MKETFNPDSFFTYTQLKDIEPKLSHLKNIDFSKSSLNKQLSLINYEFTSVEYKDYMYKKLEEYYEFEIDTIV